MKASHVKDGGEKKWDGGKLGKERPGILTAQYEFWRLGSGVKRDMGGGGGGRD